MKILLANPRGFCAGVERAVMIVERAIDIFGPPVYVRHDIVHNRHVVEGLRARGAVFVETLSEVPHGVPVVFSAHGVPPSVYREAVSRGLKFLDATCPLVTKVHLEVAAHSRAGRGVIVIGHGDHCEIVGTMGYYDATRGGGLFLVENERDAERIEVRDPTRLAYVTQTTLATTDTAAIVGVLERRFPAMIAPPAGDVCYATESRQRAVQTLAAQCHVVLVVGAPHSSNSRRLVEVAEQTGATAYLIEEADQLQSEWLEGQAAVGVTSAASTPEVLVEGILRRLVELYAGSSVETFGEPETVAFRLPAGLIQLGRVSAAV